MDANVQNLVGVGELTGRFSVLLCSGDTTPWFHLLHRVTPETACGVDGPFAAYTPSSGGAFVTSGTVCGGRRSIGCSFVSSGPVVGNGPVCGLAQSETNGSGWVLNALPLLVGPECLDDGLLFGGGVVGGLVTTEVVRNILFGG